VSCSPECKARGSSSPYWACVKSSQPRAVVAECDRGNQGDERQGRPIATRSGQGRSRGGAEDGPAAIRIRMSITRIMAAGGASRWRQCDAVRNAKRGPEAPLMHVALRSYLLAAWNISLT